MDLLSALYNEDAPALLRDLPEVEVLRCCWVEQFWLDDGVVRLRDKDGMKPSPERQDTPYDLEARRGTKGGRFWLGYKVHYTESCDDDAPHLVIHVDTVEPASADQVRVTPIHETLKQKGLLPAEHFVDSHYVTSKLLVDSKNEYGVALVGPIKAHREPTGFGVAKFNVDWQHEVVICPAGKRSIRWTPARLKKDREFIRVGFASADCRPCAFNKRCAKDTELRGRYLSILPQAQYEAREQVKREQGTWEWRTYYNLRQGIEGTFSQGIDMGLRRSRYVGLKKTHLQNLATASGINFQRLSDWLDEIPRAKTRTSRFAALKA